MLRCVKKSSSILVIAVFVASIFTMLLPQPSAFAVPADDSSKNPNDWQPTTRAQRWAYLTGLYECIQDASSGGDGWNNPVFQEDIEQDDIVSGEWFSTDVGEKMEKAAGYVGTSPNTKGGTPCNDIVSKAASEYKLSPLELYCAMGGERDDGSSCASSRTEDSEFHPLDKDAQLNVTNVWGDSGLPQNAGGTAYYMLNHAALFSGNGCNLAENEDASGKYAYTLKIVNRKGNISEKTFEGLEHNHSFNVYTSYPGINEQNRSCLTIAGDLNKYAGEYALWVKNHQESAVDLEEEDGSGAAGGTTCAIDGVGWILCPITRAIAQFNDSLFGILEGLMGVNPSMFETKGSNAATYGSWKTTRNLANVAFVIAFMVIIYSQITGVGLTNYGVKKLLPRIAVAAILVNISFWVCAVAVDISNIVGSSIHDLMVDQVRQIGGNVGSGLQFGDKITAWLLAGGVGALAVGGVTLTVGAFGFMGALALLILLAVTALVAVLTVVFVLVARQALIIILVVLSPLAFVAYLLPNTEQWFTRWRKTLFTMLLIYPAIGLVFGGSQLAAAIIRNGADDAFVYILSLAVLVVPLFSIPLLLKASGGLLGRIGGMINNPNKGPFDRMKKGGAKYAERRRNAQLGNALKRTEDLRTGKAGLGLGSVGSRRRRAATWLSGIGNANAIDTEQKETYAKASADSNKRNYVADRALEEGSNYAVRVGGSEAAASYVKAYAVQAKEDEFKKDVAAEKTLFEHEKRSYEEIGNSIRNGDYDHPDKAHMKHAAMEYYFSQANSDGVQGMIDHVAELRQNATESNLEAVQKLQQTAARSLDGHPLKPVDLSATELTKMKNGEFTAQETERVATTIASGKVNSSHIGGMDIDEMRRWNNQFRDHDELLKSMSPDKVQSTYNAIIQAENDPRINIKFGEREKQALTEMKKHLEDQWMKTQDTKDKQDAAASTYGSNI